MDDEILRQFNGEPNKKDVVKRYLDAFIAEEAVRMMYERQDVSAIPDAHMIINKAFDNLGVMYGVPEKPTVPKNEAR